MNEAAYRVLVEETTGLQEYSGLEVDSMVKY